MNFQSKILIKALNWRIVSLQSKYDYRDDKFVLNNEDKNNSDWLDNYHRRKYEQDVIMGKIYKCQDIIREIEIESNPVKVSDNDKVIGVLFVVFIALSWYGMTWFNEILK